jgi:site-specific recombinase XerD
MLFTSRTDVTTYINKFLRHLKRQNYSEATLEGYTKDLQQFSEFLMKLYEGNVFMEEVTKEDVLDYLNHQQQRGLKPNSVSRHLSSIKSLYKFLVYEMNFKVDVGARIKQAQIYTPLPQVLTEEELHLLLKAAKKMSNFYYTFFSLLYYTGSRLTPIRILKLKDVDLKNKKVYLAKTKNGQDLHLPLNEKATEILQNHISSLDTPFNEFVFPSPKFHNQPISAPDVRVNLKKISKKAGIEKRVTPHIIRHCTATHLTLKNVDQKFIASVLGHRDLRSTARYQQLNVENLRPTLNKLN